jgi:hypothetical protein
MKCWAYKTSRCAWFPSVIKKGQRLVNSFVCNLLGLKQHAVAEGELGEKNRQERRGDRADNYLNTVGAMEHRGESSFHLQKRTATTPFLCSLIRAWPRFRRGVLFWRHAARSHCQQKLQIGITCAQQCAE